MSEEAAKQVKYFNRHKYSTLEKEAEKIKSLSNNPIVLSIVLEKKLFMETKIQSFDNC